MTTILKTRLNTPTTVATALDLCQGFALYPFGTSRAGISGESWTTPFLDLRKTVGPHESADVRLKLGFGFYAGVCGPAYATDLIVEGTADDQQISLDASASETIGGLEIGVGITIQYTFAFSGWVIDDYHTTGEVTVDLIQKIIDHFLDKATEGSDDEGAGLPSGASLAIRERSAGGLAQTGKITMRPEFYFIVNLIKFIPQLNPLVAFLKQLGGTISAGPTVNLVLPFTLQVDKFRTGGHEYTVTGGSSKFAGPRTGASSVPAGQLEVVLTHQSGWEFGIGLGFEISILKYLSIERHTKPFDILSRLRIHTTNSPVSNTLQAAFGATDTAPPGIAPDGVSHSDHEYEILFEDAEVEAVA